MNDFNDLDLKSATPEQMKEISKILSKAQLGLLWSTVKFGAGLFAVSAFCAAIKVYLLNDTDVEMQQGFQFVSVITNVIFMTMYLNGEFRKNSDIVKGKIQAVLKK